MSRKLWMIVLALLTSGSSLAAGPAHPWPVKKFEVFVGKPRVSDNPGVEQTFYAFPDLWLLGDQEATPSIPMSPGVKLDIERFLAESAETFEKWGFEPPLIGPVVENEAGEKVFRIYYYDFEPSSDSAARWRSDRCNRFRPTIALNGRLFLDAGQQHVKLKSWQDVGHELFHGIQARYRLFKEHCAPYQSPGGWIYEGMAQFMGAEVAAWGPRKYNFPSLLQDGWVVFRWGLRNYELPVYIKSNDDNDGYQASAFWRFLGEYVATNRNVGTKIIQPDYEYLQELMQSSIPLNPNMPVSLEWIDHQLSANPKFGLGLEKMYPLFINTFASYGGTRIQPDGIGPAYRDRWREVMFRRTKCTALNLSQSNVEYLLNLEVARFGAKCFGVQINDQFDTDIHLSVTGPSKLAVQSLTASMVEGKVVSRPRTFPVGSEWKAVWVLTVPAGTKDSLIFSNVARVPRDSEPFSGLLEVTTTFNKNNMADNAPPPSNKASQPGGQPSNQDDPATPQAQQARLAQKLEAGMETLNPNTAHGNRMMRHANVKPCRDPFVSSACGPHTTIRLEMMPGMFGSLITSTGKGGVFGQFTSMMTGVAGTDMMFSSEKSRAALEASENMDASLVTIKIPLIDYGFTGTFRNASIVANRKGGGTWEAVEPGEGDLQSLRGPKLTGQVTIEEYSPSILRGSYSGTLIESFESGEESSDESPATRHINGSFQVVAAWAGDERIVIEQESPEDIMDDLTENYGVDTSGYEIIQVGDKQQVVPTQPSTSASSSGGSISGECSCKCEHRELADDLCAMFCEEEFAACKTP